MKTSPPSQKKRERDPDFIGAEIALKRAARKAREIARKTGTAIVIMKNGKIREEKPGHAHSDH